MKKLCICSNFSWPSVGGSELVIQSIAEQMKNRYSINTTILSSNIDKKTIYNEITIDRYNKGQSFIDQINQFDHLFIYSDFFWQLKMILNNINNIKPKISIALLGMYFMSKNNKYFQIFKKNIDKFNVITHSKGYQDYIECSNNNILVEVIPNGINIKEYKFLNDSFKEKYNITTSKVLLNISNYFHGKNISSLADIGRKLSKIYNNDFTILSISSLVKYPYEKKLLQECENKLKKEANKYGFKYKILRNIPRKDVVSSYFISDVFVFPSQKEIFPMVVLESLYTKTPVISMDVGNINEYKKGCIVINNSNVDIKGYKIFTNHIIDQFSRCIKSVLEDKDCIKDFDNIEEQYNWDKIGEKYYEVFNR